MGVRVRRLRSLGALAEPAPEPEATEPASQEPGAVIQYLSISTIYYLL